MPWLGTGQTFQGNLNLVRWKFELKNAVVNVANCLLNIFFFSVLLMRMSCQFAIRSSRKIAESSCRDNVYTSHSERLTATVSVVCSWKQQCILCSKELNSESAVFDIGHWQGYEHIKFLRERPLCLHVFPLTGLGLIFVQIQCLQCDATFRKAWLLTSRQLLHEFEHTCTK